MPRGHSSAGLVTAAVDGISRIFISNLVKILLELNEDLYLVTANSSLDAFGKTQVFSVRQITGTNTFYRLYHYIRVQLKTAFIVLRLAKKVDYFIFFLCEEHFLPVLSAWLLRKKVILSLGGYTDLELKVQKNIFRRPMRLVRKIDFSLATKIVVYSPNVIEAWDLEKYKSKVAIAHEHFLDFNIFKEKKSLYGRDNLIGYVGRLSEEKGPLNLAEAITKVAAKRKDLRFMFIGEGHLKNRIEGLINRAGLSAKVSLSGWVSHDRISACLNDFKLLVIPSYTEGLPNILLEAMACGTPVLTTPVGSIPYLIQDGITGFIMRDNSPECIAKSILAALESPDLGRVAVNGKILIENQYNFEKAVEGYRAVVESIQSRRI